MDLVIDAFKSGQLPTGTIIYVGTTFWQIEVFRIAEKATQQYIQQSPELLLTKERLEEKWWIEYPELFACIEINNYNDDKKLMQNRETKEFVIDFAQGYSDETYKKQFSRYELNKIVDKYGENSVSIFSVRSIKETTEKKRKKDRLLK